MGQAGNDRVDHFNGEQSYRVFDVNVRGTMNTVIPVLGGMVQRSAPSCRSSSLVPPTILLSRKDISTEAPGMRMSMDMRMDRCIDMRRDMCMDMCPGICAARC